MEEYTDLIKAYLLVHGHSLDYKIAYIDEEMANYIVELSSTEYETPKVRLYPIRRKKVLQTGREFYDTYFKVHDIEYATEQMVKKLNKQPMYDYDEALRLFNKIGKRLSPYDLPVSFSQKKETDGMLRMLCIDIDDEMFLQKMKPYFSGISLKRFPTILTPTSYIHELCHLEIESNKESIVDCNNSEMFPIFLEMLSLIEKDNLLKYNINKRVEYLIVELDKLIDFYYKKEKGIDVYQAFSTSKYVVSIIKALRLLLLYLESNNEIRKEILLGIQSVFDNNRTVEDILSKFDINLSDSLDINVIKKLMKR